MTSRFKLWILFRVLLGVLSLILLGFALYTIFSDKPADGSYILPLVLPMAACAIAVHRFDPRRNSR